MAHEAVADGEHCICVCRVSECQAVLHDADNDAADDVDEGDEKARDRVTAHELRRTIHRTEEGAFIFKIAAALFGDFFVDEAGGQIGVDGHLLAGHGVQAETRADFSDTARTFGDHDEVHDHEDRKDDHADDEVALHHEIAEGLNDVTGGVGAFVTM